MLNRLRALWATNPVRVTSIAASVLVAGAAYFDIVLDEATVGEVVAAIAPILLGGEVARSQVTPFVGDVGQPSDELLPLDKAPTP